MSIIYSGGEIANLSGGIQNATSDYLRKSDECLLIVNCNGDRVGSLQKRLGYTRIDVTLGALQDILGLQAYYQAGAANRLIAAVSGAATASIAFGTGGAWTVINSGQLAGAKFMGEQYLNMVYFVGYNDTTNTFASNFLVNGVTYDGAHANIANMPQARWIKSYKDLIYVANVRTGGTNYPSRVYFSGIPSAAGVITWTPATRFFTVPSDDNDPITGLEVNADRLLVFKMRSLYRWDESEVRFIAFDGCPNGRTIFTIGGLTFYYSLNSNGIFVYSGGKPKLISQKIQPIMDAIDKTLINQYYACGDYDHYYLYVGTFTLNLPYGDTQVITNAWIVYTLSTNSWYLYSSGDVVRYMARWVDANNNDRIQLGNTNGEVFTLASGTDSVFSDSGAAISMQVRYRTPIGVPHQNKTVHKAWPLVDRAQGMTFRARADNRDWSQERQINRNAESIPLDLDGKVFEFEVSESSIFSPPILNGFALNIKQHGADS